MRDRDHHSAPRSDQDSAHSALSSCPQVPEHPGRMLGRSRAARANVAALEPNTAEPQSASALDDLGIKVGDTHAPEL